MTDTINDDRWQGCPPRTIIESAEIIEYKGGWRLVMCTREVTAHDTKEEAIAHLAAAEQATLVAP